MLIFIHGGYWQRGDKNWNSFVAEPFIEAGVDVALIGYTLCPQTDIASIGAQVRKAIFWIWNNAARLGLSSERVNLGGHSAGGHLTALMLATDWQQVAENAPIDLIKTGIPISGLYQLEPLRQTSLNKALGMDANCACENSPQFIRPATMAPILAILGAAETGQFHWQMEQFVQKWQRLGVEVGTHLEPGVDHYDVINRLAQADSAIFRRVYDWLQ